MSCVPQNHYESSSERRLPAFDGSFPDLQYRAIMVMTSISHLKSRDCNSTISHRLNAQDKEIGQADIIKLLNFH